LGHQSSSFPIIVPSKRTNEDKGNKGLLQVRKGEIDRRGIGKGEGRCFLREYASRFHNNAHTHQEEGGELMSMGEEEQNHYDKDTSQMNAVNRFGG